MDSIIKMNQRLIAIGRSHLIALVARLVDDIKWRQLEIRTGRGGAGIGITILIPIC